MPARTSAASSRSTSSRSTRATPPTRRRRPSRRWTVSAEIVRVLIGLAMLLVGVSLLIGLTIQGGSLTDWERNAVAPWFGSTRWLLPVILILLGYYLERAEGAHWDWQLTLLGSGLSYAALLGVISLVQDRGGGIGRTGDYGLVINKTGAHVMSQGLVLPENGTILTIPGLTQLITTPGAALILALFMAFGV